MFQYTLSVIQHYLSEYGITPSCIKCIIAAIILIIVTYRLLKWYGICEDITFREDVLPKMTILYQYRTGKYEENEVFFHKIRTQVGKTFKISKYIGIYYDDPKVVDPANCRAVIGVIVNDGELSKVNQFRNSHPQYHLAYTHSTKAYLYTIPFINSLSFLVAQTRLLPKLNKIVQNKENVKFSEYLIQIYNYVPWRLGKKELTIAKVVDNFNDFDLWRPSEVQAQNKDD